MKKNLTEIVFILDRSGSMSGLEADTIGGYNSMLTKQKVEEGEAIISTVLFDDQTEILHDRKSIIKVDEITDKEYYVRGSTALLDAVGGAIHHIGRVQKEMPEEERPEKTLFIITTDGMENASRLYSYDKVKKMVEKKKKKHHWEFIFLGANIDAIEVAGRFGVAANRAVRYENDSVGTALNFDVMSKLVSCARACGSAEMMEKALDDDEYLAPIKAHYKASQKAKRH
ncbi:MAG: VWA domain-containing protein [Oribacterium sp.]|nr:VWA domain-containing protein [Oribacterium sp.]